MALRRLDSPRGHPRLAELGLGRSCPAGPGPAHLSRRRRSPRALSFHPTPCLINQPLMPLPLQPTNTAGPGGQDAKGHARRRGRGRTYRQPHDQGRPRAGARGPQSVQPRRDRQARIGCLYRAGSRGELGDGRRASLDNRVGGSEIVRVVRVVRAVRVDTRGGRVEMEKRRRVGGRASV